MRDSICGMNTTIRRWIQVAVLVAAVLALGSCGFLFGVIFPNEFIVDGATFGATKVYAVNWGQNASGNYDIEIYMVPDTMSIDADGYLTGQGDYAWFWINTLAPAIGANTYAFNPSASEFIPGTLYWGGAVLGFGTASPSFYFLEGGVLDIATAVIGDEFIFDFYDGGLASGGQFEAFFRGELAQALITAPTPSVRPNVKP